MPEDLLKKFMEWCINQGDIRAVAVIGSFANGSDNMNSDIDLVIVVDDKEHTIKNILFEFEFERIISARIEYWWGLNIDKDLL